MSSSFRDELLERELSAEGKGKNAVAVGLFYARPTVSTLVGAKHQYWYRAVAVRFWRKHGSILPKKFMLCTLGHVSRAPKDE